MGCLQYALDGKCCLCYDKVTDEQYGHRSDELTKIETRSGIHYACEECLEEVREKYEKGKMDIFEVKE